jgi:hypothetical protein
MANPMTTVGDIVVGDTVSGGVAAPARLGAGASGYMLRSIAGIPAWRELSAAGLGEDRQVAAANREGQTYWSTDAAAGSELAMCVHKGGATYAWEILAYGAPGLPVATGAGEVPLSTGAGTTYAAANLGDEVSAVLANALGSEPAGTAIVGDGAGDITTTSADVSAVLAAADAAAARTALGVGGALAPIWQRPAPASVAAATSFINSADLTEQVSSGLAVSPGVAASGWMQRLPTGLGAGRASLSGAPARVYADTLNLSAYTVDNVTLAVLFTWDGTQPVAYGISEVATLGDRDNEARGVHVVYITNGANTDLCIYCNSVYTVIVASANLLPGAAGLHALVVAPVTATGQKWRFSYDGSAVADVAMGAAYVAPNSTDSIGFGARPDGVVWNNGTVIDMMVWGSTLSNANILALATLPATPTYELPESASTGAAPVRIQACRYDPQTSITAMPGRGIGKILTVASTTTTKVTL